MAAILALAPLLPRGLTYAGWPVRGYVELVVPALLLTWAVARWTARGPRERTNAAPAWAWDLLLAAMAGAAINGLMAENRLTSPVFAARVWEALGGDLFRPMHQAAHPLYALRVALTFVEGWLVFRLLASICALAPDPRRRATLALGGLVAGLAAAAVLAVAQYVTRYNLHPYWVKANPSLVRSHSTFDDPNTLGACLVLAIGLAAGILWVGTRHRWRWGLLLLCLAAGLVTTMSRSSLGAVVLATLGMIAFAAAPPGAVRQWLRRGARLGLAVLVLAVLGSMALRGLVQEQRHSNPVGPVDMIAKTFDPRESTAWVLRGRLPWWQAGIAMFRTQPVAGVGLGQYPRLMGAFGGGPYRENTHNLFVQVLAETGLVGFAAFIIFCAVMLLALARRTAAPGNSFERGVAVGGLTGYVGLLLTLLTGHPLLLPSGQIVFAGFLALVLASTAPLGRTGQASSPVPAWRRAAVAMAILVALIAAPVAGRADGITPVFAGWGYHAGLHAPEHDAVGTPYRWTTGRALLDLHVPAGARAVLVTIAPGVPVRDGRTTSVRLTAGDAVRDIVLAAPGARTLSIPVEQSNRRRPGRLVLGVEVSPTFVPAAVQGGHDTRTLGVQLFLPVFETDPRGPLPR
ncbi:MAG TPA: O-antigen ligase family protein [Gemmatimonadales bacterium]|nr:O-antigen ligase family protein [Gemmatimonadales bacterium]